MDGVDVRDITLKSLRRQIGIVTQDTVLFDDTITNNIAYGAPSTSPADLEAAARAAHAHEFIQLLPEKYETRIGERGQRLSGGQRQRLAIARAVVTQPSILLLDEASSHLDVASEQRLNANLERLRCTRIVIAHRLTAVRTADHILVLDRGRVVERGTHRDLVRRAGAYAALAAAQGPVARERNRSRDPDLPDMEHLTSDAQRALA
jgi:ABC-type multidrug transport system fused ATPase/permease subunit